eukprot:2990472-Rhodomonas_salina.1
MGARKAVNPRNLWQGITARCEVVQTDCTAKNDYQHKNSAFVLLPSAEAMPPTSCSSTSSSFCEKYCGFELPSRTKQYHSHLLVSKCTSSVLSPPHFPLPQDHSSHSPRHPRSSLLSRASLHPLAAAPNTAVAKDPPAVAKTWTSARNKRKRKHFEGSLKLGGDGIELSLEAIDALVDGVHAALHVLAHHVDLEVDLAADGLLRDDDVLLRVGHQHEREPALRRVHLAHLCSDVLGCGQTSEGSGGRGGRGGRGGKREREERTGGAREEGEEKEREEGREDERGGKAVRE